MQPAEERVHRGRERPRPDSSAVRALPGRQVRGAAQGLGRALRLQREAQPPFLSRRRGPKKANALPRLQGGLPRQDEGPNVEWKEPASHEETRGLDQ